MLFRSGSDEIIANLIHAVASPGATVMAVSPSFVMFKMSTIIAGAKFVSVPLKEDFSLDWEQVIREAEKHQPALTFIAYPNNPTGNLFDPVAIRNIIENSPGLVVIDEAYHAFAGESFMRALEEYRNLVVMRTLSKLGLAGLRIGYAAARPEWIHEFDKVRGPYNVGILTQLVAEKILQHHEILTKQAAEIISERDRKSTRLNSSH